MTAAVSSSERASGLVCAVVIPHYNDVTRLIRCLEALSVQDRAGVEVVVADNASMVDMAPVTARFGWLRFVVQPEAGAGPARNAGVAVTTAPWIALLDADCIPAPDWLETVRRIAAGPPDTITGGRVDVFDETPPPRSGAEAFETVFAFDQESYIRDKGFSVTANLVMARAAFEAVGPFAVRMSEDVEWCQRATAAGFALVYAPDLEVRHPTRSDWKALCKKWRRLTEEGWLLQQQTAPGSGAARLVWTLRALAMPGSVLLHAPRIVRARGLSAVERRRALGVLARLRLTRMVWLLKQVIGVPL